MWARFRGPARYIPQTSGGRSKGWNVPGSRGFNLNLLNMARRKTASFSRHAKRRPVDGQWHERPGNVDSQLFVQHRGTGVEQQMKLSIIDKAYVSDSDTHAARGDGLPKNCRIPNVQISSAKAEKTVHYHRASLPGKMGFISLPRKGQMSGGGRDMRTMGSKAQSRTPCISDMPVHRIP